MPMTASDQLRLLEARIENLRGELAAANRRAEALTSALLFFMAYSRKHADAAPTATAALMEDLARQQRRKQDAENADELEALARTIRMAADFAPG